MVDGRWKQPHLAQIRLIGLWSWVVLTCGALTHPGTRVQPAIPTHSRQSSDMSVFSSSACNIVPTIK